MNHIVDQFSDPSMRHLFSVFQEHPETEYLIKTASLDHEENEKRASTAFAWPEARLFPIDSSEQAALSRLYMEKQAGIPPRVIECCEKALELFEIQMPLQTKEAAEVAVNPEEFLLPELKRFRVRNTGDVKLAADALVANRRKMNTVTRARASFNLVKKAVALGVRVPESIMKMAGVTMSDPDPLKRWIEARIEATDNETVKEAYQKLLPIVDAQRGKLVSKRDELVKFASVLSELDEAAGLDALYDKKLLDPLETVFNTGKVAEEVTELAGRQIPMSTLLGVDPEIYKNVFGEDLAGEFLEGDEVDPELLRTILPTVPLDLQRVLATQLLGS